MAAAGSNPPARPLVFATQAGCAVSGSTQTGLISGSHRAPLITLLMLRAAGTDGGGGRTNRPTGRQVSLPHLKRAPGISLSLCLCARVGVCVCVCVCAQTRSAFTHFPHFAACNALTASYALSLHLNALQC